MGEKQLNFDLDGALDAIEASAQELGEPYAKDYRAYNVRVQALTLAIRSVEKQPEGSWVMADGNSPTMFTSSPPRYVFHRGINTQEEILKRAAAFLHFLAGRKAD